MFFVLLKNKTCCLTRCKSQPACNVAKHVGLNNECSLTKWDAYVASWQLESFLYWDVVCRLLSLFNCFPNFLLFCPNCSHHFFFFFFLDGTTTTALTEHWSFRYRLTPEIVSVAVVGHPSAPRFSCHRPILIHDSQCIAILFRQKHCRIVEYFYTYTHAARA